MTDTLPAPRHRRPRARRARPGADLALAIAPFPPETGRLVPDWTQLRPGRTGRPRRPGGHRRGRPRAHIGRPRAVLIAALVPAVLAAAFRARRTVVARLPVALPAGGSLVAARHEWTTATPRHPDASAAARTAEAAGRGPSPVNRFHLVRIGPFSRRFGALSCDATHRSQITS
ncbi:DUF6234 family protein [Streptomyces misionensis]|uniref:DUF6234 family protein n=1 Tax=Streptomyces misionensis TaxID=67331 RepID=UPI001C959C9A